MRKLALAAALILLIPSPAHAAATITQVPYAMDSSNQAGWWSPLETYVGGNQYAYLAFNEPGSTAGTHKVAIARRDGTGAWTRLPVMNGATQAEYTDDIGHNQPSMARDGSGRFHVFASMHNNAWRYFRSDTVGGNPHNHSADLPDQGIGVTYPVLTTAPNGDCLCHRAPRRLGCALRAALPLEQRRLHVEPGRHLRAVGQPRRLPRRPALRLGREPAHPVGVGPLPRRPGSGTS